MIDTGRLTGTRSALPPRAALTAPAEEAPGLTMTDDVADLVRATRTDTGDVQPSARDALMGRLPVVAQSQLAGMAAAAVGLPAATVALQAPGGHTAAGRSGASVLFVVNRDDGHKMGVLKISPDNDTYCRELDGMTYLNGESGADVAAPRVLRVGQTEGHLGVQVMTLGAGQAIEDRINAVGAAQGADRTHAFNELRQAVRDTAAAMGRLHTEAPGSGTRVPDAYLNRYADKVDETIHRLSPAAPLMKLLGLDMGKVRESVAEARRAMFANPGTNSVCHGDAHTGNVMATDDGTITLIDFNRLHHSLDHAGTPNGSPGRDVGKFLYRTRLAAQKARLSDEEMATLQHDFTSEYSRYGAGVTPEALRFFMMGAALEGLQLLRPAGGMTQVLHPSFLREFHRMSGMEIENLKDIMAGNVPHLSA